MVGEKRWCFTICALFMLCMEGSLARHSQSHSQSHSNSQNRPHKRFNSPNAFAASAGFGKKFKPRWSLNMARDKGSSLRLEEVEPGFDFNEEEMKRLKIWPGGAIPYYIDEFSFDKVFRDRIRSFLDMTNSMTGLNFLELHRPPGDDETRWVFFINRQGLLNCIDHPYKNFTNEGVQKVILGYDCVNDIGDLAAIVLALVGVPPQHNAPNRNEHIEIIKTNIMPGKTYLFEILKDNEWLFHEVAYDYGSAGHYNLHKYTVNGKATIKPHDAIQELSLGEANGFSYTDIWKIRMIYNYISQKRLKSMNVPECNKLFDIGSNISQSGRESAEDIQPRKKPNKYLGLPDDPKDSPDNKKTKNATQTNTPTTDIEAAKEESAEETSTVKLPNAKNNSKKPNDENKSEKPDDGNKSEEPDNENEKLDDSKENKSKNISKHERKPRENIKKISEDSLDENLSAESNSQDTPHQLRFTRPGKKNL